MELREIRLLGEKRVWEGKHIMPESVLQKRRVINGTGSHMHIEVVAEEIAFPIR